MRNLIITIAMCACSVITLGDNVHTNSTKMMSVKERAEMRREKVRQRLAQKKERWESLTESERRNEIERNMEIYAGNFTKRLAREITFLDKIPKHPKIRSIEVNYEKQIVTVTYSDGNIEHGKIRSRVTIKPSK